MHFLKLRTVCSVPVSSLGYDGNLRPEADLPFSLTTFMNYKLSASGSFDRLQQALTTELVRRIKEELEKVDTPADLVEQLTGSIAFAVTCVLDDVAGLESHGEAVSPVVTFDVGEETLEHGGGSTYMHEYVFRVLPTVFGRDV